MITPISYPNNAITGAKIVTMTPNGHSSNPISIFFNVLTVSTPMYTLINIGCCVRNFYPRTSTRTNPKVTIVIVSTFANNISTPFQPIASPIHKFQDITSVLK